MSSRSASWSIVCASALCAVVQGAGAADDTAAPIDIGSRRELFVDTFLVQRLEGEARQILQHPVAREIVLVCDQPWEGNGVNYVTVFQDHEIYRMYYRGADYSFGLAPTHPQTYCYAESRDGIHWTRPEVGLVEYDGSKKNNIVISEKQFGYIAHNFSPFVDARPGVPAAERFKAIGGGPPGGAGVGRRDAMEKAGRSTRDYQRRFRFPECHFLGRLPKFFPRVSPTVSKRTRYHDGNVR